MCLAALTSSALFMLTGCQDEDFGYNSEDIKYAKAYEEFFGKLPEDKSWDLSSYQNYYDPDEPSRSITRANVSPDGELTEGDEYGVINQWWEVPNDLLTWMQAALREGKDNRYLGSNFVLKLPDNDFAIVPIYQGQSSILSDLEVKINGYDIQTVWKRSQNIQVKDADKQKSPDASGWMNLGYYDGYTGYDQETMKNEGTLCMADPNKPWENFDPSGLPMYPSFTDEADAVRAKPIYFRSKDKIGVSNDGFMYLSLHNIDKAWGSWTGYTKRWDDENNCTTIGDRLTSVNPHGHMLALNIPSYIKLDASNLPDICEYNDLKDASKGRQKPSQALLIACEDANGPGSDHDVNDVAFLIIGYPNVPTVVPTKQVIEKRYMCEDLGGTYDYDFNDIVVDCKQVQEFEIVSTPSDLTSYDAGTADQIVITEMRKKGCPVQTAKISRLCGTIPLQVRIGDFMFPKIKDPVGLNQAYADDGKYSTRKGLIEDTYYNYCNGNHANCACSNHENYASGGHAVSHQDITRAGNYEVTDGWNPNEEQIIPCHTWNPKTNNIIIYADWGFRKKMYNSSNVTGNWEDKKENNPFTEGSQDFIDYVEGRKFAVTFPEDGKYPYIIAVNPDVPWMKENETIPADWIRGDFSDRNRCDNIGNSFYMEQYPAGDGEGYIWSGEVTGIANKTGVTIKPGTAEMAAIHEAVDGGRDYYILHVYASSPVGEVGRIGIYSADDEKPLSGTDPDGYILQPLSSRVHKTYVGIDEAHTECVSLFLTSAQYQDITANGLVVESRTDGVVIRKITMARACNYDNTGKVVDGRDQGFTVKLSQPTNGTIRSNWAERVPELKKDDAIHNNAEYARTSIPFAEAKFVTGSTVTLTAVGAAGYKLDYWKNNENSSQYSTDNPLSVNSAVNLTAVFKEALNPHLAFNSARTQTEISLTLDLNGGEYTLPLYSDNATGIIGTNPELIGIADLTANGLNLKINPKKEGNTSFIIYQQDGDYDGKGYGVSGEIKVNLKVIDVPATNTKMTTAHFHEWNDVIGGAQIVGPGNIVDKTGETVTNADNGYHQTILGSLNNSYNNYEYSDVNATNIIRITTPAGVGVPHLWFNKKNGLAERADFDANDSNYCDVVNNPDGSISYIVDLRKFRKAKSYSVLSAITTPGGAGASSKITSVYLDNYDCPAETASVTITVTGTNGTATVNETNAVTVNNGTQVTLVATAASIPNDETGFHRYTFDGWYNGATKLSGNTSYTYTASATVTLEAKFISEWRVVSHIKYGETTDQVDCGYVNVTYNGTTSGMNDIWAPVGATVQLQAVPKAGYAFSTWGYAGNSSTRDMQIAEHTDNWMPNQPTATFVDAGTQIFSGNHAAVDWDPQNNHCYVFKLGNNGDDAVDLRNRLSAGGDNTFSFVMSSSITSVQLLNAWNEGFIGNATVRNGRCEITLDDVAIAKLNVSEKVFMQILQPQGEQAGLKLTEVRQYKR